MSAPFASLLLVLACSNTVKPTVVASPLKLDASLVQSQVSKGGELVLRACVSVSEPGWSWAPIFPEVQGLTQGEIRSQAEGQVSCLETPYQGPPGSYIFEPVRVQAEGPQGGSLALQSGTLFGDIGEPLVYTDLGELSSQPDRRWFKGRLSDLWVAAPVAILTALATMALWRRLFGSQPAAEPRLPPGAQALRDWQQARDSASLSDQEKGQALSQITRRYLTHVGAPQALQRTSDELVAELQDDPRLGQWCGVLRHLLHAADAVKFAGGTASPELLDQWSEGLESLVKAQRRAPPPEQI